MRKNMPSRLVKIAATLAAFVAQPGIHRCALANDLQNAAALEHAVLGGQDIHVVLDLSRCVAHDSGKPGPVIRGNLHPDEFMVLNDHGIAFAVTHFTVRPDNTSVKEFLSFRVQPDGKVMLRNVFLNPATYAILREATFDCEIGKGVTFN
jgi:hypothetical protein